MFLLIKFKNYPYHINFIPETLALKIIKLIEIKIFETNAKIVDVSINEKILNFIEKYFSDHPGLLENFWFPVTREQANKHFKDFLEIKFNNFGLYEDAMLNKENFLFHSCISSSLNLGLITPEEILKSINKHLSKFEVPLNS